ncbi:MAG: Lrp/AsnC family transcriptional regulator [Verrucomicrobium sp.]|nr:Lrp/AsnC family transcriptional regulator [Verrucomicrobium sp.]
MTASDTSLLSLLQADARATPETLAKRLGTTPDEVRAQIADLEARRVILAYRAVIDEDRSGRDAVKAVIEVKITPEREGGFDRIAHRIAKFPEVTSCFLMSGGYDLLVFIEGKTMREVALFVSEKLATVQGVLSTGTHFMLKPYKEHGVLLGAESAPERLAVSP